MPPKPEKPRPDFPLFPHANGQWAKKIRGKLHYFGLWGDPQAALRDYLKNRDALQAGVSPTPVGVTVGEAVNEFLDAKAGRMESGELSRQTWTGYRWAGGELVKVLGRDTPLASLTPQAMEEVRRKFAKGRGVVSLGVLVRITRMVFRFAFDADLIDKPVKVGAHFKEPGKRVLRRARQAKPAQFFQATELRALLEKSRQPFTSHLWLAINCGFGAADLAALPRQAVNLATGWIDFPRPKTSVERRCWLWPETVDAVRDVWDRNALDALLFRTRNGELLVRSNEKGTRIDTVAQAFDRTCKAAGVDRGDRGFYAIRHTFETVAGESRDQVAVNHIMGHADSTMAGEYREWVSDERLRAVSEHVRAWLCTK